MPPVLGISAFYHDSAAALVDGQGRILAAAQQERFSRRKHDAGFPAEAIAYISQKIHGLMDDVNEVHTKLAKSREGLVQSLKPILAADYATLGAGP